jgi:hypothetical protein
MPDMLEPTHSVNPRVPLAFAASLAKAMAIRRELRYQNAQEMLDAMRRIRQEAETQVAVCCAAVRGPTMERTAVPPFVTGTSPASTLTMSAFVLSFPRRLRNSFTVMLAACEPQALQALLQRFTRVSRQYETGQRRRSANCLPKFSPNRATNRSQ